MIGKKQVRSPLGLDRPAIPPFIVHWQRYAQPGATALGRHPQVEIQFIRHGQGQFLIRGRSFAFRNNSLLVMPPNAPHCLHPAMDVALEKWRVMFMPELLRDGRAGVRFPPGMPPCLTVNPTVAADLDLVFRNLLSEQAGRQRYAAECIAAGLKHLMALIKRAAQSDAPRAPQHPAVAWVIGHVEAHFREPLALPTLAARAGYSSYYLAHLFKRCTGMSVKQYVLQRRVGEARRLLVDERSLTVKAVGEKAGFGSFPLFCRSFRKFTGVNPAAYRRNMAQPKAD